MSDALVAAELRKLADLLDPPRSEPASNLPPSPKRLHAVAEVATILGVSVSKTKKEIAAGTIESVLVGDRRLVPVEAIDDYVANLRSLRAHPAAGGLTVIAAKRRSRRPAS